jgi:molybdopterin molybdotransferase
MIELARERGMVALPAALESVFAQVPVLEIEDVAVRRACDRVLAADVTAPSDLMPFARAAMDGYAVCDADGPGPFAIGSAVYARHGRSVAHRARTAVPIATGAPMPPGTTAVVPNEEALRTTGSVSFTTIPYAGQNVFPPGEDARRGETLLLAGRVLSPADLGLLAAAGYGSIGVRRRPRVAIICTGDELVPAGAPARRGEVHESNGVMLACSAERLGCEVIRERTVRDVAALVARELDEALQRADLVVTTGGASRGARDFVKSACSSAGVTMWFESVAIKPARPTGFGRRGHAAVFVLPGNPAAAYAAWHVLAVPYLLGLCGRTAEQRSFARLSADLHGKAGRHVFAFVELTERGGELVAQPLANQCSSLVRNGSRADALVMVPPSTRICPGGSLVEVFALR